MTEQLYVKLRQESVRIGSSVVSYTPEYFRKSAQAYVNNPGDRTKFLQSQLINIEAALGQYGRAMQELINRGAKLNGQSTGAQWMTTIGSAVMVIPTPVTTIAGAVVTVAGAVVGFVKRNQDSKELRELGEEATMLSQDVAQIQSYYQKYQLELALRRFLLPAVAFLIIYKS